MDRHQRDLLSWEVELDRLELELLRVERLLKAMTPLHDPDWVEPTDLPPLPAELLPRAEDIARRQQESQVALVRAMARTGRQRTLAHKAAPQEHSRPVYVDVSA